METTSKTLQELGAFVLAGAREPEELCEMAEMIRAASNYRWVGIYKIIRGEFVIVARTGDCPPAYPRFPITQGLAAAALESGEAIMVADVRRDPRYLPTFENTLSEIVVPVITESGRTIGLIDVESDRLNAFGDDDREFLERCAYLVARALK
ncbi:MAG TPA: GAF domain-containing protein [Chthoniobacterales bacterium]|jgi:GAF domain-containing protein